jgi:hypothetical protein
MLSASHFHLLKCTLLHYTYCIVSLVVEPFKLLSYSHGIIGINNLTWLLIVFTFMWSEFPAIKEVLYEHYFYLPVVNAAFPLALDAYFAS